MIVKLEDTLYPNNKEWVKEAINIANGIYKNIKEYGWIQGERNNQSVDWMIATYILGIDEDDAIKIITDILEGSFDKDDLYNRCNVIMNYLDDWYVKSKSCNYSITKFCCMKSMEIGWNNRYKDKPNHFNLVEDLVEE